MSQELHIKETLPALSFNYDQLKEWAHALTARYADMVVTEDAVIDVKRDMAELNKNKAKLETARKETVRRLSEPLRNFEAQIKEICGIFDETYSRLGSQVKAFEDAQREEKRAIVHEIIAKAVITSGSGLTIPVQDKWLNKTTNLKVIREDISAIIERHMEEQQRKKALEQARQDRAAAIESHVKALNQQHGLEVSVSRFMNVHLMDMSVPLEYAYRHINDDFAVEIELRQAEESARKTLVECSAPASVRQTPAVPLGKRETPAQILTMSVVLEYDIANEAAVKSCLENLKTLCVNFGARYR